MQLGPNFIFMGEMKSTHTLLAGGTEEKNNNNLHDPMTNHFLSMSEKQYEEEQRSKEKKTYKSLDFCLCLSFRIGL